MTMQHPEGWDPIRDDAAQSELLELLHPALEMVAVQPLIVAATQGVTGVTFAARGDELEVRSIGNAVARVENVSDGESVLMQVSELAGKVAPR